MIQARCPQLQPPSSEPTTRPQRERAQATVEFVGTLPLLALGAAICVQALLVALSLLFAQAAADRAARGASTAQSMAAMPASWHDRATVLRRGDQATVRVRPPLVLPGVGDLLVVRATSSSEVAS